MKVPRFNGTPVIRERCALATVIGISLLPPDFSSRTPWAFPRLNFSTFTRIWIQVVDEPLNYRLRVASVGLFDS